MGLLLLILTGLAAGRAYAQEIDGKEYFPETGHWISGPFLEKYRSVPNPEELFGYPITDAFQDDLSGLTIQYFEKTRFELHPEAIPLLRIKLSNLGSYIYEKGQTLPVIFNRPACRFYPQVADGYYVCFDFLEFFDANGGVAQFGYPISNFEFHEGRIVQYFQLARLEWRPERPLGKWVAVSNLGYQYFHLHNENPIHLRPNVDEHIPKSGTNDIRVRAFVGTPILPFIGTQTLYVIVQDQNYNAVENARVNFSVTLPNGEIQTFQAQPTNKLGISISKFPVTLNEPGILEIQVSATFGQFRGQTKTSFQVWW